MTKTTRLLITIIQHGPGSPPAVSEQTRERNMWSIWRNQRWKL